MTTMKPKNMTNQHIANISMF